MTEHTGNKKKTLLKELKDFKRGVLTKMFLRKTEYQGDSEETCFQTKEPRARLN